MITYVDGYLLQSPAQTFVNTVNTVGVMGKGIAKDFKAAFPDMFGEYRRLCELGRFSVGQLWVFRSPHKWVLNFPTKQDWRRPSKLEYIERGLTKFVESYEQQGITSAAFPALGCGNGGLDWAREVKPLMEEHLESLPLPILIYPHRSSAVRPEHETPNEISRWLRSQPEVLSFHEFWTDITAILAEPRDYSTLDSTGRFTISISSEDDDINVRDGGATLKITRDEMLDVWQHLRLNGFVSEALTPTTLEGRMQYLLPLIGELAYARPVGVATADSGIGTRRACGVQYLPPVSSTGYERAPQELVRVQPGSVRSGQPSLL